MNIFFEIHKDIPREGPGDNESTRRAFKMIKDLSDKPEILDIGCGPGMQTLELARQSGGSILAIDIHEQFLDKLNENALQEGLKENITTQKMDMFNLEISDESLELIWCEGAVFIIGFEKGIKEWQQKLKGNGYMVISELSWLKEDIPIEPKIFWNNEYPNMKTIKENIEVIESAGMEYVGHFTIPENAWWVNYYSPIIERVKELRIKYQDNLEANKALDNTMEEINLYKNHSSSYGYVFYVMKKK